MFVCLFVGPGSCITFVESQSLSSVGGWELGNCSFGYEAADGVTLDTTAPSNTKTRLQCVEGTPTCIVIFTPQLRDPRLLVVCVLVAGSWQ